MNNNHEKITSSIIDCITKFELELKSNIKGEILNKFSNIKEIREIKELNWYLKSEEYIDMFSPKSFEIEGDIGFLAQKKVENGSFTKKLSYSFSYLNIRFSFEEKKFVFSGDIIIE